MAKKESHSWWGPDPEFTPTHKTSKPLSGMAWLQGEEDRIIREELRKTNAEASKTGEKDTTSSKPPWYERYFPDIVVQALFRPNRTI